MTFTEFTVYLNPSKSDRSRRKKTTDHPGYPFELPPDGNHETEFFQVTTHLCCMASPYKKATAQPSHQTLVLARLKCSETEQ